MPDSTDPPIAGLVARPARPDEVHAILALWAFAAEDADRPVDRPEAVAALIARDPEALLLATLDDRIIGSVIAGWDGWRAHLYRLAVDPDHRGRGLARWLLDLAEDRLRAMGAGRLDAMVLDSNDGAHRVWQAAGYSPQATWSRWVRPLG